MTESEMLRRLGRLGRLGRTDDYAQSRDLFDRELDAIRAIADGGGLRTVADLHERIAREEARQS